MPRKPPSCVSPWKKWGIHKRLPLYRPTMRVLPVLPTRPSSNVNPEPSTCVSIGFKIESDKVNFSSTGVAEATTPPIISPSTIRLPIIGECAQGIFLKRQDTQLPDCSAGVLILTSRPAWCQRYGIQNHRYYCKRASPKMPIAIQIRTIKSILVLAHNYIERRFPQDFSLSSRAYQ